MQGWLSLLTTQFQKVSSTPHLDAQILLSFVLGVSRTQLLAADPHTPMTDVLMIAQIIKMQTLHVSGYPIAYLIGSQEFYGQRFYVCPGVLIPRADSECLIEAVLAKFSIQNTYQIRDVGTGPGTLGLTLAKLFPKAQVTCSDISRTSQKMFLKNQLLLRTCNAQFVRTSLLGQAHNKFYDIIVANLPYLTPLETREKKSLEQWKEPSLALNGKGKNGLYLIKKLIRQAQGKCQAIFLEADPAQMPEIAQTLEKYAFHSLRIHSDLAGAQRIIEAHFSI